MHSLYAKHFVPLTKLATQIALAIGVSVNWFCSPPIFRPTVLKKIMLTWLLFSITAAGAEFRWLDSRTLAGDRVRGPDSTWNGFREIVPMQRIDYVFVDRRWEIDEHRTDDRRIERTGESPRFPSDHLPVIVKLRLTAE